MKPVFSKTTDKLSLVAKISDDRMKLFLDAEPLPLEEAASTSPAPPTEETSGASNSGEASKETPEAEKKIVSVTWRQITRDEIVALLDELIKADLLALPVIDDIAACLSKGEKVEERRVAKGEEAHPGADGKILYLVKKFTGEVEVTINDKGFADFRHLRMFDNIVKGTIVARIYPPKDGVEGKDALGKSIPAKPGKPVKVGLDRTLSLKAADNPQENYQIVVSEAEGYLSEDSGKLSIKNIFSVNGNLDYHMGAIDFIGSVNVKGDVLPGFSIKAKTGININGSVREANLVCSEGDIVVHGYVYGGENSRIVCSGNLTCSVAQELDAEVGGNIIIGKEALDCRLRSQGAILIENGTLAGGNVLTVCGAQIKMLGTDVGKETHVILCSDVEMTAEYTQLVHSIESHEKALKLVELHLGPYAANPARIEVLKGAYKEKMKKLLEKKQQIEASHKKLVEKREEKLKGAHSNKVLRVNVTGAMYEGVVISVGTEKFLPSTKIDGPVSLDYYAEEKAFKSGELKPLECTVGGAAQQSN